MFKALRRSSARNAPLIVLLTLAWHADENGLCHPSLRRIAKMARLSKQTVLDAIETLVASGEISMLHRGHVDKDRVKDRNRPGGFQATNYYQVKVVQPVDHLGGPIHTREVVQIGKATHLSSELVSKNKGGKSRAAGAAQSIPPDEFVGVLTKVAHDLLDATSGLDYPSLVEDVKRWATRHAVPHTGVTCKKAVESALHQRQRRA